MLLLLSQRSVRPADRRLRPVQHVPDLPQGGDQGARPLRGAAASARRSRRLRRPGAPSRPRVGRQLLVQVPPARQEVGNPASFATCEPLPTGARFVLKKARGGKSLTKLLKRPDSSSRCQGRRSGGRQHHRRHLDRDRLNAHRLGNQQFMRTRFAIVCISLMAAVGSSAVPAQASTESAFCDPFGADLLHNGVAGTGFQGRGGIAREPTFPRHTQTSPPRRRTGRPRASVQRCRSGSTTSPQERPVRSQTPRSLPRSTCSTGPSPASRAARTPASASCWRGSRARRRHWYFAKSGGSDEHAMKRALRRGGAETLNLYATDGAGYLGYAFLPEYYQARPGVPRRHRLQLAVRAEVVDRLRGPVRPRLDGDARGRPLARSRAHVLRRLQRQGRLRRRHPAMLTPTRGCPEGKDTCPTRVSTRSTTTWTTPTTRCYTEFTAGPGPADARLLAVLPKPPLSLSRTSRW